MLSKSSKDRATWDPETKWPNFMAYTWVILATYPKWGPIFQVASGKLGFATWSRKIREAKILSPKNPWTLQWRGLNLYSRGPGPQVK